MENDVSALLDFYKQEVSTHIEKSQRYKLSQLVRQLASLFSPGDFYYYVLNFHSLEMEYVHESIKEVSGYVPEEFSLASLLESFPPGELQLMQKKEKLVADFLFNFLTPDQIPSYKVVYYMRIIDTNGKEKTILHQVTTLTVSDTGKVVHVLGIHTDVTDMGFSYNPYVSFINLDGGPSYYNLDPEQSEKFDPSTSCRTGAYAKLFTKRELEVIKMFAEGLTANQVGERLNISMHTIRTHRKNVLEKTDCANMTELIAKCMMEGVV